MSICRGERTYSVVKLWKETQHNELLLFNIEDFTPVFNLSIWKEGTPHQVMRGVVSDVEHHRERVEAANVDFPIVISRFVLKDIHPHYMQIYFKGGRYDVLDGVHRLYKQLRDRKPFIYAVMATREQIEAAEY